MMNKNEVVDKFLQKGLKYLESAESFAGKEVPAFLDEVLRFNVYAESVSALWSLPLFVVAFTIYRMCRSQLEKDGMDGEVFNGFLFCLAFALSGLFVLVNNLLDVVKIIVAPKMYLLEYLKDHL